MDPLLTGRTLDHIVQTVGLPTDFAVITLASRMVNPIVDLTLNFVGSLNRISDPPRKRRFLAFQAVEEHLFI